MTDWTKKQPCQECGKMVMSKEMHTFQDCLNWKKELKQNKSEG